jgi:hypothetical protein
VDAEKLALVTALVGLLSAVVTLAATIVGAL